MTKLVREDQDASANASAYGRRRAIELAVGGAGLALLGGCGSGTAGESAGGAGGNGGSGGAGPRGGPAIAGSGGAGGHGGGGAGGAGAGGEGGSLACEPFAPACEETPDDPLGPYYRAGSPFVSKLSNPKG